jgi:transposase
LLDVCCGPGCREVRKRIGRSARCVERWVNRFNELGLGSLKYDPGSGRTPWLNDKL